MIGVMDLDLWHLSDSIGVGCDAGYGQFDFNFCYVPDIIEENAINEKSCVEVLNRLIAKADTEILDLEDDLAILQSQLSWAEHEELYEISCAAFREKITSLSQSLQILRQGYTPNNHALNADSGRLHEPVERIHDIISALLEHNISTECKKECIILKADIEEREKTTSVSASLGLSRKCDNNHIIGTDNQVSDNDIKGESFAVQGAKAVNGSEVIIIFQQDCEGKGEIEQPTLRAPLRRGVKVDFDENEPLAVLLSSQGSKRKKLQSNSTGLRTEIAEKSNRKLCMNDMSAATASSKLSPASEGSRRKFGLGRRNSAEENQPLHTSEDSGPASNARSQFALSAEMKSSSMSSHSREQGGSKYSPLEKDTQETAISESTRNKLEKMNRAELMAMAKSHGLKGYHKIKKGFIVDMIVSKIG